MSTIKVDTITDEAGTGAPTFSQGAAVTGNLSATGTIAGGAFSGSGAGLTGVPSSAVTGLTPTFNPASVTGATPSLDLGSYNFFDNGTLTGDTTISFSNVPTNARWSYSAVTGVATGAGDLSTATFIRTKSVSSEETAPRSLFFKPDGMKMYIVGNVDREVVEYDLTIPWDVSTATYLQAFDVFSQELAPRGVYFKNDGTKMFIVGTQDNGVVEYALSTAWDISTASYTQEFSVLSQDTSTHDLHFSADGTILYTVGTQNATLYQYTLTTAWDVSTASYANKSISVNVYEANVQGMYVSPNGGYLYFIGNNDDQVVQYSLGTATAVNLPSSIENPAGTALVVNKRVTYEFFTMDGGTTVKLIGEEIV